MKMNEARIGWNPGTNQVIVTTMTPHWDNRFTMTAGACYSHIQKLRPDSERAKLFAFIQAFHLIVRDHVDPAAVYREFYKIDEFRDGLSEDFPRPAEVTEIRRAQKKIYRHWDGSEGYLAPGITEGGTH